MANALVVIINKVKGACLAGTRQGKVDKIEKLTKSLTSNTTLVSRKYSELKVVESDVRLTLDKLKAEKFETELNEIKGLDFLKEDEKLKFANALIEIREKGIAELEPISETAQRIKAHMLVTLNKAQIQKAILLAKSKLAGNAALQLDTLKLISKETAGINDELKDLLSELDELNDAAINRFTSFKGGVTNIKGKDEGVIEHIFNKLTIADNAGKLGKLKKDKESITV